MKKLILELKLLILGWAQSDEVERLRKALNESESMCSRLRDELHICNLEHGILLKKIGECEQKIDQSKIHVRRLWNFIAIRHRIHLIPENGSAMQKLKEADTR